MKCAVSSQPCHVKVAAPIFAWLAGHERYTTELQSNAAKCHSSPRLRYLRVPWPESHNAWAKASRCCMLSQ